MNDKLFREEVINFRRQRLVGDVRLDTTLGGWTLTGLVALIILTAASVLIFGTHTRRETVNGWLTPDKGLVRIYAPEGGVIESVAVTEGNFIEAGARLFVVSRDRGLLGGGGVNAQILRQLEEERTQIARQLQLTAKKSSAEVRRLADSRRGLSMERDQLAKQVKIQEERITLAQDRFARMKPLVSKGTISRAQHQQLKETLLSLIQTRERLAGELAAADREHSELNRRISALPATRATENAQLRARLAALEQRITEAKSRGAIVVRAPVSGRLAVVTARAGQSVRAGVMQAAILPKGGQLQAELFVPSHAAGFIRPGQSVRLRYDAFPSQTFGLGDAQITSVSKTVLNPSDATDIFNLPEPVFRVIARLEADHVNAYGEEFPLQAGMKLTADIVLEKRRIWEIIFDPLLAAVE